MKNVLGHVGAAAFGILLGVLLSSTLEWRGCGTTVQEDTTTTIVPVTPVPAVSVVSDSTLEETVDSLQHIVAKVKKANQAVIKEQTRMLKDVDSLHAVIKVQDSLLTLRSTPTKSVHKFEAMSPEGIHFMGTLYIAHEPISRKNLVRARLDSVQVPQQTIIKTETRTEWPWEVIGGAVVVGVVVGAYTMSRIQ